MSRLFLLPRRLAREELVGPVTPVLPAGFGATAGYFEGPDLVRDGSVIAPRGPYATFEFILPALLLACLCLLNHGDYVAHAGRAKRQPKAAPYARSARGSNRGASGSGTGRGAGL
jgi:hypothetical protein